MDGKWLRIRPEMVRGLSVAMTAREADEPGDGPIEVLFDSETRTAHRALAATTGVLAPEALHEVRLELVPLLHGGRLRRCFSMAGLGGVTTEHRLAHGDVVDLVDDSTGPYEALVLADSRPRHAGNVPDYDTLRQITLTAPPSVPSLLADTPTGGPQRVDVYLRDQLTTPVNLEAGASVELVTQLQGHKGVVDELAPRDGVVCRVRLVADDPDRRTPLHPLEAQCVPATEAARRPGERVDRLRRPRRWRDPARRGSTPGVRDVPSVAPRLQ